MKVESLREQLIKAEKELQELERQVLIDTRNKYLCIPNNVSSERIVDSQGSKPIAHSNTQIISPSKFHVVIDLLVTVSECYTSLVARTRKACMFS